MLCEGIYMKIRNLLLLSTGFLLLRITTGCANNNQSKTSEPKKEKVATKKSASKKKAAPRKINYTDMSQDQIAALLAQHFFSNDGSVPETTTYSYSKDDGYYVLAQGQSPFSVLYTVNKDLVSVRSESKVGAGEQVSINKLIKQFYSTDKEKDTTKKIVDLIVKNNEGNQQESNSSDNNSVDTQTDSNNNTDSSNNNDPDNNNNVNSVSKQDTSSTDSGQATLKTANDATNFLNQKYGQHNWTVLRDSSGTESQQIYWMIKSDSYENGQVLKVYDSRAVEPQ